MYVNNFLLNFIFRTITKAMIISLVLVTVIYLLTNVAYLTAMTPSDILGSDVVAAVRLKNKTKNVFYLK